LEARAGGLRDVGSDGGKKEAAVLAERVRPTGRVVAAAHVLRVEGLVQALPEEGGAGLGRPGNKDRRHHSAEPVLVRAIHGRGSAAQREIKKWGELGLRSYEQERVRAALGSDGVFALR